MRFDYDPTGATLVLATGCDLHVHDGATHALRGSHTFQSELLAVSTKAGRVVAVADDGTLSWFDATTVALLGTATLPSHPLALALDYDDRAAVALPEGIEIRSPSAVLTTVALQEASLLAWGPDGRLAVAQGPHLIVLTADGTEVRRESLSHIITAMTWCPAGFWAVATGARVLRLPPTGAPEPVVKAPGGHPVVDLVANASGDRLALQVGMERVIVLTWPGASEAGSLSTPGEALSGLAFGPMRWLGLGFEGGAAHKVDLKTGATLPVAGPEGDLQVTAEPEGLPDPPPPPRRVVGAPPVDRVVDDEVDDEHDVEETAPKAVVPTRPTSSRAPVTATNTVPAQRIAAKRTLPVALIAWVLAAVVAVGIGLFVCAGVVAIW